MKDATLDDSDFGELEVGDVVAEVDVAPELEASYGPLLLLTLSSVIRTSVNASFSKISSSSACCSASAARRARLRRRSSTSRLDGGSEPRSAMNAAMSEVSSAQNSS